MAQVTRRRGERGSELIEFALIFPMLMLIVCGIFDFGLLFQHFEVLTNAAREGARIAVLPGYTSTDVTARVNAYVSAGGLTGTATPVLTYEPVVAGGRTFNVARVTVAYDHSYVFLGPILSIFGGSLSTVTLHAVAVMRVESQGG